MGPALPQEPAPTWMVVHVDIHGTDGIVREGLGEREAAELCETYERKGHHQAYLALAYTAENRSAVLTRERILA